jgi:hypothetical protein
MREENERRRQKLLEESVQECTFTPNLSKSQKHNDSLKKSDVGVFSRLADTPTAMHPVRKEKGVMEAPVGDSHTTPAKRPVIIGKKNSTPAAASKTEHDDGTNGHANGKAAGGIMRAPSDADLIAGLKNAAAEQADSNGHSEQADSNGHSEQADSNGHSEQADSNGHSEQADSNGHSEQAESNGHASDAQNGEGNDDVDDGDEIKHTSPFVKTEKITL